MQSCEIVGGGLAMAALLLDPKAPNMSEVHQQNQDGPTDRFFLDTKKVFASSCPLMICFVSCPSVDRFSLGCA